MQNEVDMDIPDDSFRIQLNFSARYDRELFYLVQTLIAGVGVRSRANCLKQVLIKWFQLQAAGAPQNSANALRVRARSAPKELVHKDVEPESDSVGNMNQVADIDLDFSMRK